ncbi:MAG: hypothetical protein ACI4QD_05985, partial [Kiritimatiellia bacterium]
MLLHLPSEGALGHLTIGEREPSRDILKYQTHSLLGTSFPKTLLSEQGFPTNLSPATARRTLNATYSRRRPLPDSSHYELPPTPPPP